MNISSAPASHQNAGPVNGEFRTSRIRFVEHMGFLEVMSFLGEGVGAALYIFGVVLAQRSLQVLGVLFVAAAVVALFSHLGTRAHLAWRALTRVRTSWVSRGSLFMSAFMAFSVPAVAATYIDALASIRQPLTAVALIFAPLVIIYAGMMLRSMKAVSLWRSSYVPLAFSAHSLATALTITLAVLLWSGGDAAGIGWLPPLGIGFLVLCATISAVHLRPAEPSAGIQASIDRLFSGKLRGQLIWGAGFMGIVVPLAGLVASWLLVQSIGEGAASAILGIAVICRLFGDYAYRSSIVMAGAYEPIVPPPSRR